MRPEILQLVITDYEKWRGQVEARIHHRTQRREYERPGWKEKLAEDQAALKHVDDVLRELRAERERGPREHQHRLF